jgi:hypothetical protein
MLSERDPALIDQFKRQLSSYRIAGIRAFRFVTSWPLGVANWSMQVKVNFGGRDVGNTSDR